MEKTNQESISNNQSPTSSLKSETNNASQLIKFITVANNNTQNKPVVKLAPLLPKNQNKEIILKSSGGNKSFITNSITDATKSNNQRIMLQVSNNAGDVNKTNFIKIINMEKPTEGESQVIENKSSDKQNVKLNSVTLNQDQLKSLFGGSINFRNNISNPGKNSIILNKDQLKNVFSNTNEKKVTPNINSQPIKTMFVKTSTSSPTNKTLPAKTMVVNSNQQNSNTVTTNSTNLISHPMKTIRITPNLKNTLNTVVSKSNSINVSPELVKTMLVSSSASNSNSQCIKTLKLNPNNKINIVSTSSLKPQAIKMTPVNSNNNKINVVPASSLKPQTVKTTTTVSANTQLVSTPSSVNLVQQPIKTIKINPNLQKIADSPQAVKTFLKNANQNFVISPNDRFRITNQNGKKIATRITSPNNTTLTNSKNPISVQSQITKNNENTSSNQINQNSSTTEKLRDTLTTESKDISDDKNCLVFDSIQIPVGAKKIYTRRPKTPDHVYKKFNSSVKTVESLESNANKSIGINQKSEPKVIEKNVVDKIKEKTETDKKETQQMTNVQKTKSTHELKPKVKEKNVIDKNQQKINKKEPRQEKKVEKSKKRKHESGNVPKKQVSQKQRIGIDVDSMTTKNSALINNKSTNVLLQSLKSKFVPLVGHACTATIIEHLNLAYARCRVSHVQAVKELIQYVDNYERYRERKLKENSVQSSVKKETSTQTDNIIILTHAAVQQKPKEKIVQEELPVTSTPMRKYTNKRNETVNPPPKQSIEEILDSVTGDVDMFKLQVFKDWHTATSADVMGNMPIHNAVLQNDYLSVKRHCLILKHFNNINIQNESHDMTALHLAILYESDMEIFKHLLDNGVRPEIVDVNGNNCLHMIAQHGNIEKMELIMVKCGPDLNLDTCNYNGLTALMVCAEFNQVDIAKLLLKQKADPEVQDLKSGRTVLFQAIEANNEPMVELLIEYGADPKKRDYSGVTPLEVISEIRISSGIRKIMYKILSQNIVNLQRKRQRYYVETDLENEIQMASLSPSPKLRKTNDDDDDSPET